MTHLQAEGLRRSARCIGPAALIALGAALGAPSAQPGVARQPAATATVPAARPDRIGSPTPFRGLPGREPDRRVEMEPFGGAPVRGVAGDLWADVVVGQPDFTEITPFQVVGFKLFNPGGVVVDRSVKPGRAYVWDSGNSRVLGIDLAECYRLGAACTARLVLGQPTSRAHSACNGDGGFQTYPLRPPASALSLCGIPEDAVSILEHKSAGAMAVNADGDLYVADFFNHRVLLFRRPFETDAVADAVWGQRDFAGNLCNRGAQRPGRGTLCFQSTFFGGAGVAVDAAGNLWVSDGGNNRVLRFPYEPKRGLPAPSADIVLGQPGFLTAEQGSGWDQLHNPHGVAVSPAGYVLVADTANDRVLVFPPSARSGEPAVDILGAGLHAPEHVAVDPDNEGLWVFNSASGSVELWGWDGLSLRHILGVQGDTPEDCASPLCPSTGGFDFDANGNLLAAAYGGVQDVFRFDLPRPLGMGAFTTPKPAARLFSPPGGYNFEDPKSPSGLGAVGGIAVHGGQLIAGDGARILFWNGTPELASGAAADGVVHAADFDSDPAYQGRMAVDDAGRLWSIRAEGVDVWALPLRAGSRPSTRVLRRGEVLPVVGGGETQLVGPIHDVAPVGDGQAVWIAEPEANRVLRVRHPLDSPMVDVILGQADVDGRACNRGQVPPPNQGAKAAPADMLCAPGAVTVDPAGNVYVSDHTIEAAGNWRLLVFAAALFPDRSDLPVLGPRATKVFPYRAKHPAATFKPVIDRAGRMIVGYNPYLSGRFLGAYADPLGPSVDADVFFRDLNSLPWALALDEDGNLYVADSNRHRVLVYLRPLADGIPAAPPEPERALLPLVLAGRR